jgi:hypothetical protein
VVVRRHLARGVFLRATVSAPEPQAGDRHQFSILTMSCLHASNCCNGCDRLTSVCILTPVCNGNDSLALRCSYQAIIDTTDPDPSRLYKTVVPCAGPTPPAVCGPHTSADGINWTRVAGADKIPTSDEQNLSFDNKTGEFIYSVKRFGKHGRAVAVATTSNFSSSNWTDLGVVFEADEVCEKGFLEIQIFSSIFLPLTRYDKTETDGQVPFAGGPTTRRARD